MKRFITWLLILALMAPAAAFAEAPEAEQAPVAEQTETVEIKSEPAPAEEAPQAEAPAAEEAKGEDAPKAEEPAAEEAKAEEPQAEAPAAEEPKADEPAVEEAKAEEPAGEEIKAEEPQAEEPAAEAPQAAEAPAVAEEPVAKLLNAPAPADTPAPDVTAPPAVRTLAQGMTGDDVLTAQKRLKQLNYYLGALDGVFNTSMLVAVQNFQKNNGLVVDGKIGPATRAVLYYSAASPEPSVTAPAETRTLIKGMKGDDVLAAQKRLSQLGYYLGVQNGEFTSSMEIAVRNFQIRNEITADGKIGQITRNLMYSSEAVTADAPEYAGTLSLGASGENVKELQRQLRQTFYYSGTIDGIFGSTVDKAVKAFQASAGLYADGKVGKRTFDALYSRTAGIFNGGIPVRSLNKGSRGYDVKVLQDKLISLNYNLTYYQEGYFDDVTEAAVKSFQSKNGLKVTGQYDSTLRLYLWPSKVTKEEDDAEKYEGTLDDPYVGRTLRLHSYGEDVKSAQMRMLAAGYMTGKADGIFGALTKAGVIRVQKAFGLKPDGVIGPKTWEAIKSLNVATAEQTVVDYKDTAVGAYNRTLRVGSSGTDVKKLQQALITLGYDPGKVDGIYGVKTRAAVREFQFYHDLVADGVAGPKTYVVINKLVP